MADLKCHDRRSKKDISVGSFGTAAQEQQTHFRNTSETTSWEARTPPKDKRGRNGHMLALGFEADNTGTSWVTNGEMEY